MRLITNILLLCVSSALTLLIIEVGLQALYPNSSFGAAVELTWMRNSKVDVSQFFTVDPSFGFRPILGAGYAYSKYGTINNDYSIEKQADKTRLLFLGDSVTARGKLVDAIKSVSGDKAFEYWNAGVESFNTVQEVQYYKRYNAQIQPDHVILTFHLNDFETTPVAFFNDKKQLEVYAPNIQMLPMNRWLFKRSYVYRWLIGRSINDSQARLSIVSEVRKHLQSLRDDLSAEHISFSVLVLPLFDPPKAWGDNAFAAHAAILSILKDLNIDYYDLYEPLESAVDAHVVLQESPGDQLHPSAEVAGIFAKYLSEKGFLLQK